MMDDQLKQRIEDQIKKNKVFLYMKGTPQQPMCGFSARAIQILTEHGVQFGSFNVFEDDAIRQGVKEYSDWPTFPQLYVNGELVGGCDIMTELHQSGELEKILKVT
jgi:monothiol glutaredoxin